MSAACLSVGEACCDAWELRSEAYRAGDYEAWLEEELWQPLRPKLQDQNKLSVELKLEFNSLKPRATEREKAARAFARTACGVIQFVMREGV